MDDTQARAAYFKALRDDTGCSTYFFSPSPLRIEDSWLKRLDSAVEAMLDLIDTPAYEKLCAEMGFWRLPTAPMKKSDYTGCADFLLTDKGAKLIEMNINLPGKVGLMERLGHFSIPLLKDAKPVNLHFNEALVATIREALPDAQRIAIVYSHLASSEKHQNHYRFFSEELNRMGLQTKAVPANELEMDETGCLHRGERFDACINLVIPFVWEANISEFETWTDYFRRFPEKVFPNPGGGMLGTKFLLSYLGQQKPQDTAQIWSEFVLDSAPLSSFDSVGNLLMQYALDEMVLKPLKDYDTKGVYVQPDPEILRRVFEEEKERYIVQEFTTSQRLPMELENGETEDTHSVILRVFFASKKVFGYMAYYILDEFNGRYFSAPVGVLCAEEEPIDQ